MGEVTKLQPVELGEDFRFDPDEILEAAKGQDFTELCIIGRLPDGGLWVTGTANGGETLIHLERAKDFIVHGGE